MRVREKLSILERRVKGVKGPKLLVEDEEGHTLWPFGKPRGDEPVGVIRIGGIDIEKDI